MIFSERKKPFFAAGVQAEVQVMVPIPETKHTVGEVGDAENFNHGCEVKLMRVDEHDSVVSQVRLSVPSEAH